MAKKVDQLKAKQKRQKIIAGVLGVVMLGLVAFQFPRVMKQLHKKPPVSTVASSTTTPTGTPSLAAPTLSGSEQSGTATPTDSSSLTSGDVPPPANDGQLASFSRFASKDPFAQQLSDDETAGSGSGSGSSSGGGSPSSGGGSPSPTGAVQSPGPGSAVISVNGTLMSVSVGTDFPQPAASDPSVQPLFHLISLTAHTARISIVGGAYSNGAGAVTLRENRPLTLMNTADGVRYKLVLKPQGTPVPTAGSGGSTTPTVTLPAATP